MSPTWFPASFRELANIEAFPLHSPIAIMSCNFRWASSVQPSPSLLHSVHCLVPKGIWVCKPLMNSGAGSPRTDELRNLGRKICTRWLLVDGLLQYCRKLSGCWKSSLGFYLLFDFLKNKTKMNMKKQHTWQSFPTDLCCSSLLWMNATPKKWQMLTHSTG